MEKISKEKRAIIVYSLIFAYIISFVFDGQVTQAISNSIGFELSYFYLLMMFFHLLGLIVSQTGIIKNKDANKVMKVCIIPCIILSIMFWIPYPTIQIISMVLVAFISGIMFSSWGYMYKYYIDKDRRFRAIGYALINSNILMAIASFVAYYVSPIFGFILVIFYLMVGYFFIDDNQNVEESNTELMPQNMLIQYMGLLFIFIFVITIDSGFMYSIVNPSFKGITYLTSWFWAIPYICALFVLIKIGKRNSPIGYLHIAIGLTAIGFILFMLLDFSSISYFIVDSFLLFAAGILDLFWVCVIGEYLDYYENPIRMFALGLVANAFGVVTGSYLSRFIIQMNLTKEHIVIIALVVICISLIILPYVIKQLELIIENTKYMNTYKQETNHQQQFTLSNTKPVEKLTSREEEILVLVLSGKTNENISDALHISKNTVRTHMRNILSKYEVSNRIELISKVLR
ncbi:MAG: LuxR family transcriptional regulator [Thomasclavelia sp.]|nr:LuxR family transcriptional regulator [Thomasclavelia sp.]